MWRSAFVPVVLLRFLKRFTSGRVTISDTSDTTRNTADWIVMSLVNIVVIAAQTEPRTNHIDTSCVVKPSQSNINIAKPIHTIGIYCSIGLSPSFSHNFNTILYISQTILLLFHALTDYFVSIFRFILTISYKEVIKIPTNISIEHHYLSVIILILHSLFKNIEVQIFKGWVCNCYFMIFRGIICD